MLSNYRVAITCADPFILQVLVGLLKEDQCKITEEDGGYFWSSSLFETSSSGAEVARKADQYLPALNGLVELQIAYAPKIVRGNKIFFTNESGGTGAYFDGAISLPLNYTITISEEELRRRQQKWVTLVKTWAKQVADPTDALNTALIHFGEEVTWNSLYNLYEIIKQDYNASKGRTNKRNYILLPEEWTTINGKNREKDFTESANNAYISGIISARHSLATSDRVVQIEESQEVEVTRSDGRKERILPMSLREAKEFVASILVQWITSKQLLQDQPS